jgi:hypothetical protein
MIYRVATIKLHPKHDLHGGKYTRSYLERESTWIRRVDVNQRIVFEHRCPTCVRGGLTRKKALGIEMILGKVGI